MDKFPPKKIIQNYLHFLKIIQFFIGNAINQNNSYSNAILKCKGTKINP